MPEPEFVFDLPGDPIQVGDNPFVGRLVDDIVDGDGKQLLNCRKGIVTNHSLHRNGLVEWRSRSFGKNEVCHRSLR